MFFTTFFNYYTVRVELNNDIKLNFLMSFSFT